MTDGDDNNSTNPTVSPMLVGDDSTDDDGSGNSSDGHRRHDDRGSGRDDGDDDVDTGLPPGVDLKVGSTILLCGLTSSKGSKLNGSIGQIAFDIKHERYPIVIVKKKHTEQEEEEQAALQHPPISRINTLHTLSIKAKNMKLVCSNPLCYSSTNSNLMQCSKCNVAVYCNTKCQAIHWKLQPYGHRKGCQELIYDRRRRKSHHRQRTFRSEQGQQEEYQDEILT